MNIYNLKYRSIIVNVVLHTGEQNNYEPEMADAGDK